MDIQLFQHHLLKRVTLLHCASFAFFVKDRMTVFTEVHPWVLCFVPLMYLFFQQYHTVLITIALWSILKSDSISPLIFFSFSLNVVLTIHKITLWNFDWHCIGLKSSGKYWHLDKIESFCPWTRTDASFIYFLFDNFLLEFCNFSYI